MTTSNPASVPARSAGSGHFHRSVGPLSATAINMTQMCGIGPFITIPIMVATMGGPQAILGWIVGALLAITDGLVWAELGAAMPGAGGTYIYLREAFQYRTGKLMPFLFVWTAVISIPLIMSTGIIGLVQYLGFYFPQMSSLTGHLIGLGAVVLIVAALYRRIESIRLLTTALWIIMLITVVTVIAACFTHFSPHLAFTYPAGAFHLDSRFFAGLGAGLLIAIYDYLGYNTVAYMGDELKDPGRTMPRSIIYSIFGMMLIYLALNIGVLGVVPWHDVAKSDSVASLAVTTAWGPGPAKLVTGLIIITAAASVFAGLLGGSRVPFHAARDKVFFGVFGPAAPAVRFPARGAAGDGSHHGRGLIPDADHRDQHADRGRGTGSVGRPDRGPDRAPPPAAGPAPPLPAMALPGAEPAGADRLAVRLQVGYRPGHLALAGLDRRRAAGLRRLGPGQSRLAVCPDQGAGGLPRSPAGGRGPGRPAGAGHPGLTARGRPTARLTPGSSAAARVTLADIVPALTGKTRRRRGSGFSSG